MAFVAEKLCTTRPIRYSEILEMDRKIREFKSLPDGADGSLRLFSDHTSSKSLADVKECSDGSSVAGERRKDYEGMMNAVLHYKCGIFRESGEPADHATSHSFASWSKYSAPLCSPTFLRTRDARLSLQTTFLSLRLVRARCLRLIHHSPQNYPRVLCRV